MWKVNLEDNTTVNLTTKTPHKQSLITNNAMEETSLREISRGDEGRFKLLSHYIVSIYSEF